MSTLMRNSFRAIDDGRLLKIAGSNKYYGSFLASGHLRQIKNGDYTPMNVIHNERLGVSLTLVSNYKEETNTIIFGRANEGPIKNASRMAFAKSKLIMDNRSYTHLLGTLYRNISLDSPISKFI